MIDYENFAFATKKQKSRLILDKWWEANCSRSSDSTYLGFHPVRLLNMTGDDLFSGSIACVASGALNPATRFHAVRTFDGYVITHGNQNADAIQHTLRSSIGPWNFMFPGDMYGHDRGLYYSNAYTNMNYIFPNRLGENLLTSAKKSGVGRYELTLRDIDDLLDVFLSKDEQDAITLQIELGG